MNKTTFKGLLHDDIRVILANKISSVFPVINGSVVSELWAANPNVIYDIDYMMVRMDGDGLRSVLDRFEFDVSGIKYSSLKVDAAHKLWVNLHNLTLTSTPIDHVLSKINPTINDGKISKKSEALKIIDSLEIMEKELKYRKILYGRFYFDYGKHIMTREWPYVEGFEENGWQSLKKNLGRTNKVFNKIKIKPIKELGFTNYQI